MIHHALGDLWNSTGHPEQALRSFEKAYSLFEDQRDLIPAYVFRKALALSQISALTGTGGRGEEAGVLAVKALRQAAEAGFRDAGFTASKDLDPIRSRPDFKLLILDLEFPADPFADPLTP